MISAPRSASSWRRPGWFPFWQRNFLVWKKLALPSILGNLADPLIYMLGLGYGVLIAAGELSEDDVAALLSAA